MIPKKIHYCWLSGEEIPEMLKKCMATWKEILPDYEWVLWDTNKFDITSVPFVKEAVNAKKWAFASDYIRLFAVHSEGGIYMDMDVIMKKSFDDFLTNDFFSAMEYYSPRPKGKDEVFIYEDGTTAQKILGTAIQAAVFGAVAGHPFLKDCMKWYESKHFILPNKRIIDKIIVAPSIYATIAQRYGFLYKNEEQNLAKNMKIYPSQIIAPSIWDFSKETYAIHCCVGSWLDNSFLSKITKKNNFLRKLFGRTPIIKDMYEFVQNSPVWK